MSATVCALGAIVVGLWAGEPEIWNFERAPVGEPRGFESPAGTWAVVDVSGKPGYKALAQTAKSDRAVYNVVLSNAAPAADLDLAVRILAIAGEIDQGGGLIWRAKDSKTYYVARYNPLEGNLRLYHVVDGTRTQIASADIEGKGTQWHTLRISMHGDHIEVYLDSKRFLDVHDGTLTGAGRIGLWTKADAQTHFDDLTLWRGGDKPNAAD
jgi:hypothetical protein